MPLHLLFTSPFIVYGPNKSTLVYCQGKQGLNLSFGNGATRCDAHSLLSFRHNTHLNLIAFTIFAKSHIQNRNLIFATVAATPELLIW